MMACTLYCLTNRIQDKQGGIVVGRVASYRAAVWIGYYHLLPNIIGYFLYNFKIHELLGGNNVCK